jgi:hypothetical protein
VTLICIASPYRLYEIGGTMRLKTLTIQIDERIDNTLNNLQEQLGGRTTKAEVFRLSIALLKIALEAHRDELKLAIVGKDNTIQRELVLPIH